MSSMPTSGPLESSISSKKETHGRRSKRRTFAQPKESVIVNYKRALGAFLKAHRSFESEYGESFIPGDKDIPEAHRLFFRVQGMRDCIQDEGLLRRIHEELGDKTDVEWE